MTDTGSTSNGGVFISYSHDDKRWMNDLLTHLKPHVRAGSLTAWSDQQIKPGSQWLGEIKAALSSAKVGVLLVTPSFLASDFIYNEELTPLLKEAEQGGVKILWIPVRPSAYEISPLQKYQAAIDPKKPLALMKAERDIAWVQICREIVNITKAVGGRLTDSVECHNTPDLPRDISYPHDGPIHFASRVSDRETHKHAPSCPSIVRSQEDEHVDLSSLLPEQLKSLGWMIVNLASRVRKADAPLSSTMDLGAGAYLHFVPNRDALGEPCMERALQGDLDLITVRERSIHKYRRIQTTGSHPGMQTEQMIEEAEDQLAQDFRRLIDRLRVLISDVRRSHSIE